MLDAVAYLIEWIVVMGGLAVAGLLYFLPTIIVLMRRAHGMAGVVIVLNLFLGWTFLGWVVSLALSLSGSSAPRQQYYAYPPQPSPQLVPTSGYPLADPISNGTAAVDSTAGAAQPTRDS